MIEIATLGIAIDKSPVEETMTALDQLGAKGDAVGGRVGKAFTGTNAVARDVAKTMGENVVQGSARAESSLRRVEFAAFQIIETGNLSAGSLRGLAVGMSGLVESALPIVGIGVVVVETIKAITNANEAATKAADAAAEAERKHINELSRPVVQRTRTPEEDIAAKRNVAQADRDRADAIEKQARATLLVAAAEQVRHPLSDRLSEARQETQAQLDLAAALRVTAAALGASAQESAKNLAANRAAETQQSAQDYLKGLRDEAALSGLTGAALERETAIRHGYGRAVADQAAELRREIDARSGAKQGVDAHRRAVELFDQSLRNEGLTREAHIRALAQESAKFEEAYQARIRMAQEWADKQVTAAARAEEAMKRAFDVIKGVRGDETLGEAGGTKGGRSGGGSLTSVFTSPGLGSLIGYIGGLGKAAEIAAPLLGGFLEALVGSDEAARRAREAIASFERQMEALRSDIAGTNTTLADNIRAERERFQQLRESAISTYGKPSQYMELRNRLAELNTLEQQRIQKLEREAAIARQNAYQDLRVRDLRATNLGPLADDYAFALQQQRELAAAVRDGADAAFQATLAAVQREEVEKRAADLAIAAARTAEDLHVRLTRATVGGTAADNEAFILQQQREYADAVRAGADAAFLATLRQVQLAEATARTATTMQDTIDGYTRTIGDLQTFKNSLLLDSRLSPLSPVQQLAEARRQYNAVLALARGGDLAAASQLPAVSQALLNAGRNVYASSMAYADQFNQVQKDVDDTLAMFAGKKSDEQLLLETLRGGIAIDGPVEIIPQPYAPEAPQRQQLDDVIRHLQRSAEEQAATTDALYGGFAEVSQKLTALSAAVEDGNDKMARKLAGIALS